MEDQKKIAYIGEDESIGMDELYTKWYRCSLCKDSDITRVSNYCPNCGAKIERDNIKK